jgi:hypothetical protein
MAPYVTNMMDADPSITGKAMREQFEKRSDESLRVINILSYGPAAVPTEATNLVKPSNPFCMSGSAMFWESWHSTSLFLLVICSGAYSLRWSLLLA